MALRRFFVTAVTPTESAAPREVNGELLYSVAFTREDYHHLATVVRIGIGERVELVERETWRTLQATVVDLDASTPSMTVSGVSESAPSALPFELDLYFGLAKGDTSETVVRMATELGVAGLVPFISSRGVVRLDGQRAASRRDRLAAIAAAAVKQSHRSGMPSVETPLAFHAVSPMLANYDLVLVAWEEAEDVTLTQSVLGARSALRAASGSRPPRVALVIGPEGGLAAAEVEAATRWGGIAVSLGPTILRVDTAVAAGLALCVDALTTVVRTN